MPLESLNCPKCPGRDWFDLKLLSIHRHDCRTYLIKKYLFEKNIYIESNQFKLAGFYLALTPDNKYKFGITTRFNRFSKIPAVTYRFLVISEASKIADLEYLIKCELLLSSEYFTSIDLPRFKQAFRNSLQKIKSSPKDLNKCLVL